MSTLIKVARNIVIIVLVLYFGRSFFQAVLFSGLEVSIKESVYLMTVVFCVFCTLFVLHALSCIP